MDTQQQQNKNQLKSARRFDIEEMMSSFYQNMKTKNPEVNEKNDSESEDSDQEKNQNDKNNRGDDDQDEDDDDDDDLIGPPLPPGFNSGENKETENEAKNDDDDEDEDADADEYDDNDDNRYKILPISHEIELIHGKKSVTALALDPNGARLVSGGIDYEIKFWDFQGMDSTLKSFRTITPCHSHSIKHLEFSSNGELILVVSGSSIAKLVDRDGYVKSETMKGDRYISDMKNTKGHVAMLNYGCWHPLERNVFSTCSSDGTCRMWDVKVGLKQHQSLMKPRSQNGLRAQPNVCAFSHLGDLIAVGCDDGSVQMWDTRKSYVNTAHLLRDAHQQNTYMSSLVFGYNGSMLATRSMDNTMKLWDMRMVRQSRPFGKARSEPIHSFEDLYNRYEQTDCCFSPDDQYLMTAVSFDERPSKNNQKEKEEEMNNCGQLRFYSTTSFDLINQIDGKKSSSNIRAFWHPKLNQIVTSSSDGSVQMYYDTQRSIRGALLCSFRQKRKRKEIFSMVKPTIITPHALPLFKQDRRKSHYVQMLKDRKDPLKSRRPDLPITGSGSGGRIAAAGKTFASFIARNLGVKAKIDDNEDPREALIKHSKEAEENPYWVTPAYRQTQPVAIFSSETQDQTKNHDDDDEDEDDDDEATDGSKPKKRKHIPV